MGLTIQTQRANAASPQRAYSLIERTTGTVLYGDIDGLIDVEAVLSRIVWDRQLARANGPPATVTGPSCPSCGTPRVGQFRWCRTCGRDFEPTAHTVPRWPPFQLPEPDVMSEPKPSMGPIQPTEAQIQPTRTQSTSSPMSNPIPRPDYGPGPRRRRWPFRISLRDRDSILTIREIAIGAMLGLLIGAMIAAVSNMR